MIIGCGGQNGDEVSAEQTTIAIPTAAPTSAPENTSTTEPVETQIAAPRFELTVWLAESIQYNQSTADGTLLITQMSEFDVTHPDVNMVVTNKKIAEQGGTLSYLRTGRSVAPDILPDVVILPADQLATAVDEGLVFSLETLVSEDGFYPAALELARVDGVLYGVPFALTEMHHAVYDAGDLGQPLPDRWDELVALENARMVLAAAGSDGAELALQLYASESGSLDDEEGGYNFEGAPLASGLSQLKLAADAERIQPSSVDFSTIDAVWAQFERRETNIAMVDSERMLAERAAGDNSAFAALPGRDGEMRAVVSGYVWAISTPDVTRQAISAELIQWLTNPQNLGTWSAAASMLPARPVAFAQWTNDPYTTFLQGQLQQAVARPNRLDSVAMNALQAGVLEILSDNADPAITAGRIIDTPRP